jgi:serine/threonine protein kinase
MPCLSDERDPCDLVAEEFTRRCRNGEQPAASEYAARYPDLADQLRDLLPAIAMIEQARCLKKAGSPVCPEVNPPARLGDFRIGRELGRGGMGIVYEAVQESLGRVVALKVLPTHALLDAKKRQRFLREAQAAARLRHANIVPVFGVGEENGLPYYVMQLVDGKSLHEMVAEWSGVGVAWHAPGADVTLAEMSDTESANASPFRGLHPKEMRNGTPSERHGCRGRWADVARLGIQAANALDHAHKQGILHRDIKPANLLVDRQGKLWVTDFGLAKVAGQEDLTNSGDLVGTLNYMPPERFRGQADARSDVYGLGLTLYELLVLQPPFRERDAAQLLKTVSEQEPAPPRRLNPLVPRDLETIVLKAIARDRQHRYQTAGELAEDLQRFLDNRPIRARRATVLERLSCWVRRNRACAALIALVIASTTAAVVGYVSCEKARAALKSESSKNKEAAVSSDRARTAPPGIRSRWSKDPATRQGPGRGFFTKMLRESRRGSWAPVRASKSRAPDPWRLLPRGKRQARRASVDRSPPGNRSCCRKHWLWGIAPQEPHT